MLVLTRRAGERIVITESIVLIRDGRRASAIDLADNIVLEVVAVHGGRVQIGISAPPGVRIVREELLGKPD